MKNIIHFALVIVLLSCTNHIDLPNFNEAAWKADKYGCEGFRTTMQDQLEKVKNDLKGLNSDEIVSVLGKPNKMKLSTRNQKYFMYTISPIEKCANYQQKNKVQLSIRFNAVGLAYEAICSSSRSSGASLRERVRYKTVI